MRSLLTLSFIAALWILSAFAALAQSGTSSGAVARPPPTGWEQVKGTPESQKVDPNPLVVGAYAAFFVGMFGYVVFIARKQTEMAKEMGELAERIKRAENK